MVEKRKSIRDTRVTPAISCIVKLPSGATLDGFVEDLSENGAGISGTITGLCPGDAVELVLVVHVDQRVMYQAEVKHIDAENGYFGVRFNSGPQRIEADDAGTGTMCCGHKQNTPFCPRCGRRLSDILATNTART